MPRARNIKHQFFTDADLLECGPWSRLLFAGLWTIADKSGRLIDKPKQIKLHIFPGDDVDVDGCLSELAQHGFITRYEVDATRYIQIRNFTKHQNPHPSEAGSTFPPPPEQVASKLQALDKQPASTLHAPRNQVASRLQVLNKQGADPADSGYLNPDPGLLIADGADPGSLFADSGNLTTDGADFGYPNVDGADPGLPEFAGEESWDQQQGSSEAPASSFYLPEYESAPLSENDWEYPEEPPFGDEGTRETPPDSAPPPTALSAEAEQPYWANAEFVQDRTTAFEWMTELWAESGDVLANMTAHRVVFGTMFDGRARGNASQLRYMAVRDLMRDYHDSLQPGQAPMSYADWVYAWQREQAASAPAHAPVSASGAPSRAERGANDL